MDKVGPSPFWAALGGQNSEVIQNDSRYIYLDSGSEMRFLNLDLDTLSVTALKALL